MPNAGRVVGSCAAVGCATGGAAGAEQAARHEASRQGARRIARSLRRPQAELAGLVEPPVDLGAEDVRDRARDRDELTVAVVVVVERCGGARGQWLGAGARRRVLDRTAAIAPASALRAYRQPLEPRTP